MITENSQGRSTALPAGEYINKASVTDEDAMFQQILVKNPDLKEQGRTSFHWHIKNFKSLPDRLYSPSFKLDGYSWRISLFPRGNIQKKSMSIYLEVTSPELDNWYVCCQFAFVISSPRNPSIYFANNAKHRFTADEIDWGFTRFYDIDKLAQMHSGTGPFLENGSITISAFLRTIKDETGVLWHNFSNYDSRKATGYVGIRNQGATGYMTCLLQLLYFNNEFRKAIYRIPTAHEDPNNSVVLALQRIFYNLQYSPTPVETNELTKSFGWGSTELYVQHDILEFNRVLQDNLVGKMKGTPADGAISKLFKGKMKSYIKCIDVDYESSRSEDYDAIDLYVKGCKNLEESFNKYIQVEILEGHAKHMTAGHGLQNAKKGVIFESFPPVLNLELRRFDYDFMQDAMVKINDRHEFPAEINLDKFCIDKENGPYDYELHGVIVHSGDLTGGKYSALLRPGKEEKWYRFVDDRVVPVTKKDVFEENFGNETIQGNNPPLLSTRESLEQNRKRFTNAYMLVYFRKSKLHELLAPVKNTDIPFHLKGEEEINNENTNNEQIQPVSSTINNDNQLDKTSDDKVKSLMDAFQSKIDLMEKENKKNKKKSDRLEKEQLRKDEENKQLREELAKLKAQLDDDTNNDFNYDSSDNDTNDGNDINYDSECDKSEEEEKEDSNATRHPHQNNVNQVSTANFADPHYDSDDHHADPNYDSSDNEDLTKDINHD